MTLYILQNNFAQRVLSDLRTICPDPNLSVDSNGRIIYVNQSLSSVGCQTVFALANHASWIGIRAELPSWSASPQPNSTLHDRAGVTAFDVYPNSRIIDIAYSTDCGGLGYYVMNTSNTPISMPSHVILFHELSHALRLATGTHTITASNSSVAELEAISDENLYRVSFGLPIRQGIVGGCISDLPRKPIKKRLLHPKQILLKKISTKSSIKKHSSNLMLTAIGNDHLIQLDTSQWFYTVTITNYTTDTFDSMVLFYKRINQTGVVFLQSPSVGPNQTWVFNLGPCTQMESYAFGLMIGNNMVFSFPADVLGPGINMTPQLASAYNPTDIEPCADSWSIQ